MIENVLDTKSKVKVMKFFANFTENQFQAIEVARRLGLSVSRTSECLKDLAEKGILESKKIGKGYIFKLNKSNYLARIITDVFRKDRMFVDIIAKDFVSKVKRLGKIKSIVLFGSALKELKFGSDVDFLVVYNGKIDEEKIYEISSRLDTIYGFYISILTMSIRELREKAKRGEEFVLNVLATHKLLYGKPLEDLIW